MVSQFGRTLLVYLAYILTDIHTSILTPLLVISVVRGGYLDLRFVTLYRAGARRLNNDSVRVSVGSTVMIDAGATFIGTG